MKKIDLINAYATEKEVSKKEATDIIESVIALMRKAVIEEGELDLFGFMKITKVHKDATTARNVKTGEPVAVPAKFVPKAKFAAAFKREVNAE